jgi:hypothetical protein
MEVVYLLLALVKSLAVYAAETALNRKPAIFRDRFATIRAIFQTRACAHACSDRRECVLVQMDGMKRTHLRFFEILVLDRLDIDHLEGAMY